MPQVAVSLSAAACGARRHTTLKLPILLAAFGSTSGEITTQSPHCAQSSPRCQHSTGRAKAPAVTSASLVATCGQVSKEIRVTTPEWRQLRPKQEHTGPPKFCNSSFATPTCIYVVSLKKNVNLPAPLCQDKHTNTHADSLAQCRCGQCSCWCHSSCVTPTSADVGVTHSTPDHREVACKRANSCGVSEISLSHYMQWDAPRLGPIGNMSQQTKHKKNPSQHNTQTSTGCSSQQAQ